jgi:ABC-type amino acid transport substrate-binding protein
MPSISTGRVDAILSGFTDYASRHEIASFVDYLRSGPQFFVQQSRKAEFKDAAALCGKKVGASRRTMFPAQIAAWSEDNVKWVGSYLAFAGRIDREKWVAQARDLAAGRDAESPRCVPAGKVAPLKDDEANG